MTKAIQLNPSTGTLETTDILSVAAKRRDPHQKVITRTNGLITQVSWYLGLAEIYRKEVTWQSGFPTLAKHFDYVNNVTRCKEIAKVGGALQVNVGLCPDISLLWGSLPIQWGDSNLDWTAGGDTAWGSLPIRWGSFEVNWS